MQIFIGLGNPGEKYKNTRHNAGFMAINAIAEQSGLSWQFNKKFQAEICEIKDAGKTILVKPQTFMNNSGQATQALLSYYKLLPKSSLLSSLLRRGSGGGKDSDLSGVLTVIHDDLDIELGKYKISVNSRSAGHNGVRSIINHLKTKNFRRVRIGLKNKKPEQMPAEKYVLQKFSEEELNVVNSLILKIINELTMHNFC